MANIEVRKATKSYGAMIVLHGVSIDINDGEFVVLVGPSGCGKSTLLRMIAGLEEISGGEIAIDGRVVNDLPAKSRDIAMVFQSYALYPHMTVEQNMGFSLKIARRPKAEIDQKVSAAADILSLQPLLRRKPAQLSGGQRQRVAMGRAIVRNPAVFLFDEPLSNLDAQLRVQMRAEIKALHQRLKTTTVYVTHDQVEAMTMADRIVVMSAGHVEQMGRPLELFDRPENLFVARFIGSPQMNLIAGRIDLEGGIAVFRAGDLALQLGQEHQDMAGRDLTLGFRPDQLQLGRAGAPEVVDAKVTLVEPTGTETMVNLDLHGHTVMAVFRERIDTMPGQTLPVLISADRVHLFDTSSGQRIN